MKPQKNIALLIIDVQKAIDHPSWGIRNNPEAEKNMSKLLSFWRAHSLPVIHVKHESLEPNSTYRPGQSGCDFKDEVIPAEGEKIIVKRTNSAFIGTELDALLRADGINSLVIAGVITNNSVEATARMSGNLGFKTYVVSDATATFNKKDYNGVLRTADEVHAMSLSNLEGEYAEIVFAEEIIALLTSDSGDT